MTRPPGRPRLSAEKKGVRRTLYITPFGVSAIDIWRDMLHELLVKAGHRKKHQRKPTDSEVVGYALAVMMDAEKEFIDSNGHKGMNKESST